MHRFFALPLENALAYLPKDEEAHALKVLRMKEGDACQALMDGRIFEAEIKETYPRVLLSLKKELPSAEPSLRVTLYQGIPKGEKMDYIVQKCTEAGVFRIVPVSFSRCVSKWEGKDAEKKRMRYQRIALEAAKQSGRALAPEIALPITVKQLGEEMKKYDLSLIPWEEQRGNGIRCAFHGEKNVCVVIGPEGGIDGEEAERLVEAGGKTVTLGPRIFRTETAGLASLVALLTLSGDME